MTVFDEPKIDCHAHVLDPERFPYNPSVAYKPSGQEIGTAAQMLEVMDTFGTRHTLLVQPNSGYGNDNSCMLDAVKSHPDRFKGVAIVDMGASLGQLNDLKAQGVVGVAFNPTFYGTDYYGTAAGLIEKLADCGLFVNLQYENDQLRTFEPWIRDIPVTVLIDHLGRPTMANGLDQTGFRTLLGLAEIDRVYVKLSGYNKYARTPFPFPDCEPYVRAVVSAFGLDRCLWASDWPYLRATDRQDYGPLVRLVERLFPDADDRRKLFWDTPARLLGFGG